MSLYICRNLNVILSKSVPMFTNIQLTVERGRHYHIYTAESIGKTTLLHSLCLIKKPSGGELYFQDEMIYPQARGKVSFFFKKARGLMLSPPLFCRDRSVLDNLLLLLRYWNGFQKGQKKNCEAMLYRCQLLSHKNQQTDRLTPNELQRLAFALSVIHQPLLVFADQPLHNLNQDQLPFFQEFITDSLNYGTSWITTGHTPLHFPAPTCNYQLTPTGLAADE